MHIWHSLTRSEGYMLTCSHLLDAYRTQLSGVADYDYREVRFSYFADTVSPP